MTAIDDDDRRVIGAWAAVCAARVLPLFVAKAPVDARPREALAAVRAFVRGETKKAPLRKLAIAAHRAAREVDDPVATAAARAAGVAAAAPFTHNDPETIGTAKHVHGAAVYAARARELAAGDPRAADQELRSAIARASPALRKIVRKIPRVEPGRSRFDQLLFEIDRHMRRMRR